MEILERIEQKALELYGKYGVKAITMDDIARSCGISKKTLYENFANKRELVDDVVTKFTVRYRENYPTANIVAEDAIAEVILSIAELESMYRCMNYIMFEDLEKYYFDTWDVIAKFRNDIGITLIKKNIERGIKESLYHDRFEIDIIANMRLRQLIDIHREAHMRADLKTTLYQVTYHYIAGLATAKGNKLLTKYIEQYKR